MQNFGELFTSVFKGINSLKNIIPSRGLKYFAPPPTYPGIVIPEKNRLKFLEKVPQYGANIKPPKMQKRIRYIRGPELIHNTLLHKQYGIIAKSGGRLRWDHIEMIRLGLIRKLDPKRMFAAWRIDPPWQPLTKKSLGHRMGGGKGSIDHYVTPIKAERVIVEVAGKCEFHEVKRLLDGIACRLPFAAISVSQSMLDKAAEKRKWQEENNINPYTFKWIVQNNVAGCHQWLSPFDHKWFGRYK